MNAAARRGFADARLVRRAVDVNVTRVRVHAAAAIEAGFESFQPQDARGDFGVRKFRLRCVADGLARLENRSRRRFRADFFRDAMQSERRAIRAFRLPDAETRRGAAHFAAKPPGRGGLLKKRNGLPADADDENKLRRRDSIFPACIKKFRAHFSKSAFAARPINLKNRGWTNTKMRTAARVAREGKVKISRQDAKTRSRQ